MKVRENVVNARRKHCGEWGTTFLVAAVGCASMEAVSEITVIICFGTLFL